MSHHRRCIWYPWPPTHFKVKVHIKRLIIKRRQYVQVTANFSWVPSVSADVVSQVFQVVDEANVVVSHQVLGPAVNTLSLVVDFSKKYTATVVAVNELLESEPATVVFTTPDVPARPASPTELTETSVVSA